ncbi:MAG: hypothetical protein LBR33_07440 [Propionibacteriaceae bacterium]|nr:hypothetical protein [Propionibacteriaceae bacterium]
MSRPAAPPFREETMTELPGTGQADAARSPAPRVTAPDGPARPALGVAIRPTSQSGGIVPGLFTRRGIAVVNESDEPMRDLVVAGLGSPFAGQTLVGSPIPLLAPGQEAPYLFAQPPGKAAEWVFRVSYERPDGSLVVGNLPLRPRGSV